MHLWPHSRVQTASFELQFRRVVTNKNANLEVIGTCNDVGQRLPKVCCWLSWQIEREGVRDYVVECSWSVMAHCDERVGKWRGNWRMEWVASTLYTTSELGVSSITIADAHTSAASSQLNWHPCRLNDSSVSSKDEIWFLRMCHHVSNAVYWLCIWYKTSRIPCHVTVVCFLKIRGSIYASLSNVALECLLLIVSDWELHNKASFLFDISKSKRIKEQEQQ